MEANRHNVARSQWRQRPGIYKGGKISDLIQQTMPGDAVNVKSKDDSNPGGVGKWLEHQPNA